RQRRGHVRRVAGSVPRRAAGSLIAARVGDRPGRRAPRLGRARVNPGLSRRQLVAVLIGLMLGMLVAALSQTIVATALPTIVGELGGQEQLAWVVLATLRIGRASRRERVSAQMVEAT